MLQFLTYIIVYPIAKLISLLPFPILYFISDLFYYLFFYVIGYRKKLVLENMQKVFPEKIEEDNEDDSNGEDFGIDDDFLDSLDNFDNENKDLD